MLAHTTQLFSMIDAALETTFAAEVGTTHPVFGFMFSFVHNMPPSDYSRESWEMESQFNQSVVRPLKRFCHWLEQVWPKFQVQGSLNTKDLGTITKTYNHRGIINLHHQSTGLEASGLSEDDVRRRLKDMVISQLERWQDAGNPLEKLDQYQLQIIEIARETLNIPGNE